ncbi:MAG: nucleotidyltransferase domain-containing protein [Chloroflexota bacterium]|nr:nucleotidyltransferase domain-containing protein [Chloroflexota bacterium]
MSQETIRNLEDLRQWREQILALAHRHRARQISVFGSVARGDSQFNSDIDFLVDFEEGYRLTDHIRLLQGLRELLPCSVDVVDRRALRPEIRENVLAEAQPL